MLRGNRNLSGNGATNFNSGLWGTAEGVTVAPQGSDTRKSGMSIRAQRIRRPRPLPTPIIGETLPEPSLTYMYRVCANVEPSERFDHQKA